MTELQFNVLEVCSWFGQFFVMFWEVYVQSLKYLEYGEMIVKKFKSFGKVDKTIEFL